MKKVTITTRAIIAIAIAVPFAWWLTGYHTWEFQGHGSMTDHWIHPRYRARLGQVPLDQPGEHQFSFRGLPDEEMWLELSVGGKTLPAESEVLQELTTTIEVTLKDGQEETVCDASGKPSQGMEGGWIVTASPADAAFWHFDCTRFRTKRGETYKLTVRLTDVDPNSPKTFIVPILKGGGIELP